MKHLYQLLYFIAGFMLGQALIAMTDGHAGMTAMFLLVGSVSMAGAIAVDRSENGK